MVRILLRAALRARAIVFFILSSVVVAFVIALSIPNRLIDVVLVAAYALFIVSRPRMQRVIARLRDEPSWRGYYRN